MEGEVWFVSYEVMDGVASRKEHVLVLNAHPLDWFLDQDGSEGVMHITFYDKLNVTPEQLDEYKETLAWFDYSESASEDQEETETEEGDQ